MKGAWSGNQGQATARTSAGDAATRATRPTQRTRPTRPRTPRKPAARRGQLALDLRRRTKRGEIAKRAGRPPTGRRVDPRHRPRAAVDPRHPIHVVLRTTREVGSLRGQRAYRAVRGALLGVAARHVAYRVVHVSIQRHHLHLIVEADDARALARGMQGFAIAAAKRLNRELRRTRGTVFPCRYHATAIATPAQARNALAYVLNNWRRHREDQGHKAWRLDPYSSARGFDGWSRPIDAATPRRTDPLPVVCATTWLLTAGWRRAGPIHTGEVPGPDPTP